MKNDSCEFFMERYKVKKEGRLKSDDSSYRDEKFDEKDCVRHDSLDFVDFSSLHGT
jgi:major membrane immunogen (membrane-anchored lipoprotein)